MSRRRPTPTFFPYTTLFRSRHEREPDAPADPDERRDPRDLRAAQVGGPHVVDSDLVCEPRVRRSAREDRKSTRLNSSHQIISYAIFCLKKKTHTECSLTPHA